MCVLVVLDNDNRGEVNGIGGKAQAKVAGVFETPLRCSRCRTHLAACR